MLDLYRDNLVARWVDTLEAQYASRGEAFFHVSGIGHAASSALVPHLTRHDWLHCHYRDKAMMITRGMTAEDFFLALFCKDGSHSRGRQMSAHMSAPDLKILSIVGPVGNNALQAVGVAAAIHEQPENPLVVCCLGDGTVQQGEVLEALGEAVRSHLPVLFLIEDNHYAISTRTAGKNFYSRADGLAENYLSVPIRYLDGTHIAQCHDAFGEIVSAMRSSRGPEIVVLTMERLADHTNADDQRTYRQPTEITDAMAQFDPLKILADKLVNEGVPREELDTMHESIGKMVAEAAEKARSSAEPVAIRTAKAAPPKAPEHIDASEVDAHANGHNTNGDASRHQPMTMVEVMRGVLRHWLKADPATCLYGQDIEDPKGDVFGLTRGLSTAFPARVVNAPLTESTIVGVSIGRALAGQKPVAMLQFADFMPLALNQIISELITLHWRTDGSWQAPVIIMAPCGGFKAGLGPFHAQTYDSIMAHLPGLDVAMPSNAEDAAGLLNAAFASNRPTLFLYPKALLNDRTVATTRPLDHTWSDYGKARLVRAGSDLTLVCWGNTVALCVQATKELAQAGFECEILDLRTLSPWDHDAVLESAVRTGRLLVVHEDNISGGFGAEVGMYVAEHATTPVKVRRVARADTHIPCNFANQLEILPNLRSILEVATELLDAELQWRKRSEEETDPNVFVMEAFGTSPSDEMVTVLEWYVKEGDEIEAGKVIAEIEADKATGELAAPVSGHIEKILIDRGNMVRVGTPLMRIRTVVTKQNAAAAIAKQDLAPVISRRAAHPDGHKLHGKVARQAVRTGVSQIAVAKGSLADRNTELVKRFPDRTEDEILKLCGIESRCHLSPGEDRLSLAMQAVNQLLATSPDSLNRVGLIVGSTGIMERTCPSLACEILAELDKVQPGLRPAAFDLLAACTGYVYALQIAHDFVQQSPDKLVLVVTAETVSQVVDPNDFSSRIIFADAASACFVGNVDTHPECKAYGLARPNLYAKADHNAAITTPAVGAKGFLHVDGYRSYKESTRAMGEALRDACRASDIELGDLRWVVPHQVNQRILNTVERSTGLIGKVYSNIRLHGNTSSSSIPLALNQLHVELTAGDLLGLVAFGGGFTYGSAIMQVQG